MAKICMISVNHSPLDDRIFYKEALTLKGAGHELFMICRANANGVMYDMGNTTPLNKEGEAEIEFEGIPTYPISSPTYASQKVLKKIFKGEFYTNYINQGIAINADVYHAHEPESFYIGLQIAKKTNAKVVFDSHESYTTGTPKERWIKRNYLKDLRYLITANHLTRGYLVALNPKIKSQVIYNAAQPSIFTDTIRNSKPQAITIAHDGYLPFTRGLKEMLSAFKLAHQSYPEIKFKIIGKTTGDEAVFLNSFLTENNLQNAVTETGWIPYSEVANQLKDCQIGIIAKQSTINNIIGGPPIKYYNYTAAGMAIIDVDMPETTRLITQYKNGISIADRTVDGLFRGMITLIENNNLRKKYQENSTIAFTSLNWNHEGQKLIEFYQNQVLSKDSIILH